MDQMKIISRGLKRESFIATCVAAVLVFVITIGLGATSGRPGSNTDWAVVRSWALFVLGLFAYGRLARKVAQIAEAISRSESSWPTV